MSSFHSGCSIISRLKASNLLQVSTVVEGVRGICVAAQQDVRPAMANCASTSTSQPGLTLTLMR